MARQLAESEEMSAEPRVLATVTDYPSLLAAFRARATERQIAVSSEQVHHVAGLSDRRISQMLSLRTLQRGKSKGRVGMISLGPLLGVLGVKLLMVEDADALRQFGSRLGKRNENLMRNSVSTWHMFRSRRDFQEMGRKGRKSKLAKMTEAEKSELGRRLAKARWSKPRVVQVNGSMAKKLRKAAGGANIGFPIGTVV